MDHKFTEKLKAWLAAPETERDYADGALMLLQLNNNRIQYTNTIANLSNRHEFIAYNLQKYYNFRVQELTHEEVEKMQAEADKIVADHFSYIDANTDASTSESNTDPSPSFKQGKRDDHDSLPAEIQALYVENGQIMKRMREVHLKLRTLSNATTTCPDSDRFPFLKELIELDKKYHKNWDEYDHYIPTDGTSAVAEKSTETQVADQGKILKALNLAKGRYKKNPTEATKAKILDLLSSLTDPSETLIAELTDLGIIDATT